jgi:hypothetical protein
MSVPLTDQLVRTSLASFVEDVFASGWRGREHEAISRYVFGHVINHVGVSPILKVPTQICVHGTVPGVPGKNPKGRVNKDLQFWPSSTQTTWNAKWKPEYIPLCVQEWKVFRPTTGRPRESEYDIEWLQAFSELHHAFVGYAVTLDLAGRDMRLTVTRACAGHVDRKWMSR